MNGNARSATKQSRKTSSKKKNPQKPRRASTKKPRSYGKQQRDNVETTLEKLCEIISQGELTQPQLKDTLVRFLFSIGSSLENCDLTTSEEVLMRYASNPTFGNALMTQALHMNETWGTERKDSDE